MKKFIHKVQGIGKQAARIKLAMESAPAKAAELREIVSATTGQLQQLGADIQAGYNSAQQNTEQRLVGMLQEIDASAEVFREAGYALSGAEMELGTPQRLVVHLNHVEEVSAAVVRALIGANESKKTTHAILSALHKADELAGRVDLTNLTFNKLTVYVGPLPCVRLCWEVDGNAQAEEASSAGAPVSATTPSPSPSMFGADSFFERRSPAPETAVRPADKEPEQAVSSDEAAPEKPAAASVPAKEDPLARFKKMPDLSKYQR